MEPNLDSGVYRSLSSAHWVEISGSAMRHFSSTAQALVLECERSHDEVADDLFDMWREGGSGQVALQWGGRLTPQILEPTPLWPDAPRLAQTSDLLSERALNAIAFFELVLGHQVNSRALSEAFEAERRALLNGAARGERALFAAMADLLRRLRDGQGELWGRGQWATGRGEPTLEAQAYAQSARIEDAEDATLELLEKGKLRIIARRRRRRGRQAGRGRIHWWVEEKIGHLAVLAFDELSDRVDGAADSEIADAAFSRAVEDFIDADVRGVIVDLRLNSGGWDSVALRLAERLTDRERPLFDKAVRHDGRSRPLGRITVAPAAGARISVPVAVLQSGLTVSAAEVALLALGPLPQTRSFGWRSFGAFSDAMTFRLPNGWRGTLSNEIYTTLDGMDFERVGAPPDIEAPPLADAVEPFWDAFDAPLRAADDWLRKNPGRYPDRRPG